MKKDYWDVSDEQVLEKTGKHIADWIAVMDAFGTAGKPSTATVVHLQEQHGVPRYWARTLTTHYLKTEK